MYNCVVCRYHEVATKGNNRNMFERCLADNIRHLIRGVPGCRVRRIRGRIWIELDGGGDFTDEQLSGLRTALERAFGLESFSPAVRLPVDLAVIRSTAAALAPAAFARLGVTGRPPAFRVRARRSNKHFELTSRDLEIDLVTLLSRSPGVPEFKIDLDAADLTLGCEIRDEFALLFFDTGRAPSGLPVGSNPRVLVLLSGGIDSPVAAWMTMKRGSACDFISFHSSPYTPPETTDKVRGIAAYLNTFQRSGRLHLVNLAAFQRAVRDCCGERFRTVLYRRAMFRIAEQVARATGCKALVTGESLGQVASQTVVNLDTINHAVDILVLRPLIGADKLETIAAAEAIGTFRMSNVQVPDSCTVFSPASPATAVPRQLAEAEERRIPDYGRLLEETIQAIETV